MIKQEDGRFDDGDLLTLMNMIKIWDFYDGIGWTGPDGEGTPMLMLMNWVDEEGEPVWNACYDSKESGFQVFCFNRAQRDGECLDTLGHEFTHCVSSRLVSDMLFINDSGAISEGLSDTMGNLIETHIAEKDDPEWLIGEGAGDPDMILRCMSDPHRYKQPEYTWDRYYASHVETPTDKNDSGGVHVNSSLLNLIAWRLHENGMPVEDEFYYWMNVIMAIVPGIDYPMMAKLLPWCMKQTGCEEWLPVLEAAIQETRIAETEPGDIPDGCFMIRCEVPESLRERSDMLIMTFLDPNWKVVESIWPDVRLQSFAHVLQAGDYQIKLDAPGEDEAGSVIWLMAGDNWVCLNEDTPLPDDILFTYQAGRVYALPTEGLEFSHSP